MAQKSISQLDTISQAHDTDLFEVAAVDAQSASGYKSGKMSAEVMAEGLLSTYTYPTAMPNMQNKTITGALNQLLANFAPAYDNTETYSVGDVCTYNGQLYKCTTAVSTAETFDPTKWVAIVVTELSGGHNYSTSEHVIGIWTDGSAIYEKTVEITTLLSGSDQKYNHNISNIDSVVGWEAIFVRSDGVTIQHFATAGSGYRVEVVSISRTQIGITCEAEIYNTFSAAYITIRYTKSTS